MTEVNSRRSRRRGWAPAAGAGVLVEAAALIAASVAYAIHASGADEPAFAAGLAAFMGISGAGLAAVGVALWRGAAWPATASLTWQVLQVLAGLSLAGERPALGVPLAVVGVAAGAAAALVRRDAVAAEG